MKKKNIIIISAPACSGKNSIYNEVHKNNPELIQTISDTTRKIRSGEKEGVDYNYISMREFKENIKNELYIEYNFYNGNFYGTPTAQILDLINDKTPIVLIIDVNGALKVKKLFGEQVATIFIMPPSLNELKQRMIDRGENTLDELNERIRIAELEIAQANRYDYCVINEDLEQASNEVNKIIKQIITDLKGV